MGSRGSVIPYFQDQVAEGKPLPITDIRMTRFWISLADAVKFVLDSFSIMQGGELYVPRIPSMKIVDLARAIGPKSELVEIGTRPGEKLHEEMISAEDSPRTKLIDGSRYVVLPVVAEWNFKEPAGESLPERFAYASDTNSQWMTVSDIQKFIASNQ
jgi:UDP-N-acetylglucosamine 4,6-dehydratase